MIPTWYNKLYLLRNIRQDNRLLNFHDFSIDQELKDTVHLVSILLLRSSILKLNIAILGNPCIHVGHPVCNELVIVWVSVKSRMLSNQTVPSWCPTNTI